MSNQRSASHTQLIRTLEQHPGLPSLLQSMPPRVAATLLQRIGISDAAELMALLPIESSLRTLDESIWQSARPGLRAGVDVAQLCEWLETWHDIGEAFLLERLAAMSDDYLVLVLSCLVRVDTETQQRPDSGDVFDAFIEDRPHLGVRFGPFDVQASHEDYRDVARTTLHALWAETPERLLRLFGRMSHAHGTPAAQRSWVTTALDVEFERESFREAQGYVSVAGARAFLTLAGNLTLEAIRELSQYDLETRRHLASFGEERTNPVQAEESSAAGADSSADISTSAESASLQALLEAAELVEPVAEQLRLTASDQPAHGELLLTTQLRRLAAENPLSFHERGRELAYLANVLKAGIALQEAPLSDAEAKDAAFATCNLGVELAPDDAAHLHGEPGLVRTLLLGWHTLRRIAPGIVAVFEHATTSIDSWIREEAVVGLEDLRVAVAQNHWSDARDACVFLTIVFDTATCRAIAPLLDEIPRYSQLLAGSKQPEAVRWITTRSDLDRIAALLNDLAPKRPRHAPR
jgi:hypothetical protein